MTNSQHVYRIIFLLAGTYNLAFAIWLVAAPASLFGLINISIPFSENYILPLAIGIALYVPIYIFAILHPEKAKKGIGFCLLSKIGTLFLACILILAAGWPVALLKMVFFNDVIWWIPFFLFLRKNNTGI